MPFIQKAKTGTGNFVQIAGYLIWIGCGLYIFIYELGVIYDAFGFWLAAVAFIFFPVVYGLAFLIDWFITGIFPLGIFILWIVSWVGLVIVTAGASIKEAQGMGWFQRHLNWTFVITYLLSLVPNASNSALASFIALAFFIIISGWIIRQKGRRLWWLLLIPIFSPLWLKQSEATKRLNRLEKIPMGELSIGELRILKEKYIANEDESGVSIIDDELTARVEEDRKE